MTNIRLFLIALFRSISEWIGFLPPGPKDGFSEALEAIDRYHGIESSLFNEFIKVQEFKHVFLNIPGNSYKFYQVRYRPEDTGSSYPEVDIFYRMTEENCFDGDVCGEEPNYEKVTLFLRDHTWFCQTIETSPLAAFWKETDPSTTMWVR
jgi:hypothetical protein